MKTQTKEDIRRRVETLRGDMKDSGIDMLLLVSTDPHASEYVDEHDKVTEYFSGCTSDNVVFIVEQDSARLWTDGRYFISAAGELLDTGIALMKMGEPNVPEVPAYIRSHLAEGQTLGFNGRCVKASAGEAYRRAAAGKGARVDSTYAPADRLWVGRPALTSRPVWILQEEEAGESAAHRIERVRGEMEEKGAAHHVLTKLDDIMWLLNLRGSDVSCNPVAFSYALLGRTTVDLFLQDGAVTEELTAYLRGLRVKLHEYGAFYDYLRNYHYEGPVLLDPEESGDAALMLLEERTEVIKAPNPTALMKAKKNPVELAHIRETYLRDSAAVCKFICRIRKEVGRKPLTELDAAALMDGLRREIPSYLDLSFPTISAYQENAAMAHYAATEENASTLREEGFLLVDSGGQYRGGTTDVTRTVVLGPLTEEMKRDFTLVAAANLRLLFAKFPKGTPGIMLDMIAREPLFRYGLDFNHGTGHGIGYILNVHEGPQRIGRSPKGGGAVGIEAGMLLSDEPGVYKEGRYGIRTESIVIAEEEETTEFGTFLHFTPITFVPIDLEAIDPQYLEPSDVALLNRYHRMVWTQISPLLEGEELEFLREATRELT